MAVQKTEGFIEFSGELQAVETLARETGQTIQSIMQQAKRDEAGYIRLVGSDEFNGRLAAEFSAMANNLNIVR